MKSSGISAVSMVGDAEVIPDEMTSSRISLMSMVGDAEVVPMDVDVAKEGGEATRKGEPNIAIVSDGASSEKPAGPSEKPAEDKTEFVDPTEKKIEVDKPVGRPAEKKMPKPEKQKAPESKAASAQGSTPQCGG